MHEMSIARSLIQLVEREAEDKGFSRVEAISLKIGEFSGLVPQCLIDFFPYAAEGTIAQGAKLEIEQLPAAFRCLDCGYEGAVDPGQALCPSCGSAALRMTQGTGFYVDSLKVE